MYLPETGFTPQTRNDMLITSFNFFKAQGYAGSYEEFSISNTATWLDGNLFPLLDRYQDELVKIQEGIWRTLHGMYGTIEQGVGSALNPFMRELAKLGEGVFISTPNVDANLPAGTIGIYLDHAIVKIETDLTKVEATLANIAWPGMVSVVSQHAPQTKESQTYTVNVEFINGQFFSYDFYNLHPSDYTAIHIRINLDYKANATRYEDADLIDYIREKLHHDLKIGAFLYVDAYLNHLQFPNLANLTLQWSTDTNQWHSVNYQTKPWQRLSIATLSVGGLTA
ncbi:hypothetical protein [Entomospira culicis]|uniref:Uncharacterized protein n=1 Tax=Entomospira culicis TaxID=2719989 RepID=A0A968GHU7_9SPIO|nr:hypothetical protein [Entomospira culicis]NIZ19088.1 hypothetical protein [Entomospira culicis]NIZ69302.1 hypothetical protein [Entomospira culicis]WDI37888.1 hypothetical protein PVA46_03625 [Entomospira culicis]WDI39515.1 hypothetical protein PVA47_03625 [Entomospira culicis]